MDSRDDDPIRYKYAHATAWDYTSQSPQLERLRRSLEAEYDRAGATPGAPDPARFMLLARETVKRYLDGMADARLLSHGDADAVKAALFPFDSPHEPGGPTPCLGDRIALDALEGAWKAGR